MACKRSGVRIPLAPQVRSEIRTVRTASTAAKYSNAAGTIYGPASPDQALLPRLGCWHSQLKPGPGTGLRGRDQEERPIRPSIDSCPAAGTRRPFPGDPCRLGNTSGQPCPAGLLLSARMPAEDCAMAQHGAPVSAGAASSVSRRGCGAPRRNLAHPGRATAPSGAGQALTAHGWPRSAPGGRHGWRRQRVEHVATPSEHAVRAKPSAAASSLPIPYYLSPGAQPGCALSRNQSRSRAGTEGISAAGRLRETHLGSCCRWPLAPCGLAVAGPF